MTTRLRAPAEHGAILIDPPLDRVADLLDQAGRFCLPNVTFLDLSHGELRDLARRETLELSANYHREHGEPIPPRVGSRWVVAGHQPELFHPGVWLKNFVLAGLARQHQAVGLNLIVDNDTLKHPSIRIPTWHGPDTPPEDVRAALIRFDDATADMPYEEVFVHNEADFRSFPEQIAERTQEWPERSFVGAFWQSVIDKPAKSIGERFAAARRKHERDWGACNRELPLSRLCRSAAFARFAGALMLDLPRFHAVYNQSVREYRRAHRVRSRNHPVPDLASDTDWLEAPFWAWRAGAGRRTHLFVRRIGDRIELRAGAEPWPTLSASRFVDDWPALEADGYKVRTRALTTTLFARLLLADLFMHGLGGGLYDRLTDAIALAYFGASPPAYLVVTGTMRLSLPTYPIPGGTARRERDLIWNPQRHLNPVRLTNDVRELLAQRAMLIALQPTTRRGRRERYLALRENLARLRPMLADSLQAAHEVHAAAMSMARANSVLTARDYSFVLHSEAALRSFLQRGFSSCC